MDKENKEVTQASSSMNEQFNNRVCSFDPTKFLTNLEKDPQKPPRLYLTVNMRVHWLQAWCQENGKSYLIREGKAETVPGTSFIQSECTVYIDGEPAGIGVGGFNLAGQKDIDTCVQNCATIAKGRALANAGFGSVLSSSDPNENGAGFPCDSGIGTEYFTFTPQRIEANAGNPLVQTQPVPQAPAKQEMRGEEQEPMYAPMNPFTTPAAPQPSYKATTIPATDNAPKTREEALEFVVPMKGTWFGHKLGEVLAKSPKDVKFFSNCRIADLKAAAQLVLDNH